MSVLYPRLIKRAAEERFGEFAGTDAVKLTAQSALRHPAAVFAATGGRRVSESELRALRDAVVAIACGVGFPRPPLTAEKNEFDVHTAERLHRDMGIVPAEAAVRDVWAFFALVLLPDVAYWRFPEATRDRMLATDITRHAFGRLWWRAHLLIEPGADEPYWRLGSFGEAAFDQIFARRRAIGGSRALIRALAAVWPDIDRGANSERTLLRETLKLLARRGAFQEYDSLGPDVLVEEIRSVIRFELDALDAARSEATVSP